ncbi:MAG: hypothetical protein WCE21_00745 [Candidatus Babeliales bacterium]
MQIKKITHKIFSCITIITCATVYCAPSIASESDNNTFYATIFIHGIVSIKPHLTLPNIVKFMRDKIAHTHYARTVEILRHDLFFYQQQAVGDMGLHKIDTCFSPNDVAPLFAHLCSAIATHAGDTRNWHYYTFGWSGLLSPRMRYLEAAILYQDLLTTFLPMLKEKKLFLRIIAYSHGGNVALKLADIFAKETKAEHQQLRINELALVGIPVLPETDYLIASPLFETVYHFYSYGDRVQRMDCFSLNRMFSNRIFKSRSSFELPQKLKQVHLSIKKVAKNRVPPITSLADKECAALCRRLLLRTADPGHSELWSFGWIPSSYRIDSPIYPLPGAVFIPYLIALLQQQMDQAPHVLTELHPGYGCVQLYDYRGKKGSLHDFLPPGKMDQYRALALQQKPANFTKHEYNKRVLKAKQTARAEWRAERNIRWFGSGKKT